MQLFSWFHLSDYHNFWNNERWSLLIHSLASFNCFTFKKTSSKMEPTLYQKWFNIKFTAKIDVLIGCFMLPLLMMKLEILSPSIHSLISICTTCWWNWMKLHCPNYTKFWVYWQKMVNHFCQTLTQFGRHFCSWNHCLMLNHLKLPPFSVPKIMTVWHV